MTAGRPWRSTMLTTAAAIGALGAAAAPGEAPPSRTSAWELSAHEPYLAVRTGLRCSACHTNVTGGGNRTTFGSIYAQTTLPRNVRGVVSKAITDFLDIGWDLRAEASGTFESSTPRTSIGIDVAQVYLAARLLNERLVLYIDETVGPNRATSREAFAMVRALPGNGYAKVGKFLLPYGLRLQDDAEFIRERTGFSYFTPDQGIEVGFEPGPLSFSVALTNGAAGAVENNDGKQVTASMALVARPGRIGVSGSQNHETGSRRDVVGGFAGLRLGPLALLGEIDYVRDDPTTGPDTEQLVAYGEADLLIARGVNLKATYGYLDPTFDDPTIDNGRVRARFGVEAFPFPFIRLAAFYTLLDDVPQATTDLDRASIEAQVHF